MKSFAKFLSVLSAAPSSLSAALAIFTGLVLFVPGLSALLSPFLRGVLTLLGVLFAILFVCQIASPIASLWFSSFLGKFYAPRVFHLTPVTNLCFWSTAKQADGTFCTQIVAAFVVKNRTDAQLRLLRARLIKPKIDGEVLQDLIHCEIPPRETKTVRITILVKGPREAVKGGDPRRLSGNHRRRR